MVKSLRRILLLVCVTLISFKSNAFSEGGQYPNTPEDLVKALCDLDYKGPFDIRVGAVGGGEYILIMNT